MRVQITTSRCEREPTNDVASTTAWSVREIGTNTMVGHIPLSVAAVLTELSTKGDVTSVQCKVTGESQRAPGGTFVPGGGPVVPCIYKLYGHPDTASAVRQRLRETNFGISDMQ